MDRREHVGNSARNMTYGLISQGVILILNFVVRMVFTRCLNEEYLGINGLFTNILTILSLAELGFGIAMNFSLYKPLAEGDNGKISALMSLYRKVYAVIGIVIAAIGVGLLPFLDFFIKDKPDISNLELIYLMYLGDTILSYLFFAYKRAILQADQRTYLISKYHYIMGIIKAIIQITVLITTHWFILYLAIQLLSTLCENIAISFKVNQLYPFLKNRSGEKLGKADLNRIKKDVQALVLSRIGSVALNGTDSIIISSFVGIGWVGRLSNYSLVTGSLTMVLSQISSGITGSVGHYIASENQQRHKQLFDHIDFMNFWLYGFSAIALATMFDPFIGLFFGNSLKLPLESGYIIAINFFLEGMLQALWTFRTTMGLFTQGKYRPLIAAVINIVVSIGLAQYMGITGVLLGTTISRCLVNVWYDPYIIFKTGLNTTVKRYYITYIKRVVLIIACTAIMIMFRTALIGETVKIIPFIILTLLTAVIPNVVFLIVFRKSDEFIYFYDLLRNRFINKLIQKG